MKLGVCIEIVKISFGIALEQISSVFDRATSCNMSVVLFLDNNFNKYQWILTKLGMCMALILLRSALRLLMGKLSTFDRVICPQYICILLSGQ